MNRQEKAVELFTTGLTCSQAILTVFGEPYGLDPQLAKKMGRALGGGLSRQAKTCGAVSGAAQILGLAREEQDEVEARTATYCAVGELFRRFGVLHGTTECKDLLGLDIGTEEGIKTAREQEMFTKVCPAFVRDAAAILEDLLKTRAAGS